MRRRRIHPSRMRAAVAALLCIALLPLPGIASGIWYTFTEQSVPEELGFLVSEDTFTGDVNMTFLGDCTLGSEESKKNYPIGYIRRITQNGMDFPMRYLSAKTAADDLTVANLECVLTDRALQKVDKRFNFSGPTAFTGILTAGSIECVTLANNHTHDYGEEGYQDTRNALEAASVSYFGTDCVAVWQHESGLRIGFTGVSNSLSGNRSKRFARQVELLRSLGCAAIITVMHAGTEYSFTPDRYQKQITDRALKNGVDLVVGHHPHVVQGYEILGDMPVIYSLGNCSYGGVTYVRDPDAMVLGVEMHFSEGALEGMTLRFHPISITSDEKYNNYSPRFLSGKEAERVLKKMENSTGNGFGKFTEAGGAPVEFRKK